MKLVKICIRRVQISTPNSVRIRRWMHLYRPINKLILNLQHALCLMHSWNWKSVALGWLYLWLIRDELRHGLVFVIEATVFALYIKLSQHMDYSTNSHWTKWHLKHSTNCEYAENVRSSDNWNSNFVTALVACWDLIETLPVMCVTINYRNIVYYGVISDNHRT